MSLPFTLPDWVPWWVQLVILVVAILVAGAFVLMPFSVFGVKSRLDALDARLDELQADLRDLAYRLPDPEMRRPAAWRRAEPDDADYYTRPDIRTRRDEAPMSRRDEAPMSRRDDPQTSRRDDPHASRRDEAPARPPIPPAPVVPERERPAASPFRPRGEARSEPQLRWPSERD